MQRNSNDSKEFNRIAKQYGIDSSDVKRAVFSFFDILHTESSKLPFDVPSRIYTRSAFNEFDFVYHIPYIGRVGTVYSRYLCWRRNESRFLGQKLKSEFKKESKREKADMIARHILSGDKEECSIKKTKIENYKRVWMVDKEGKRLAGQVLPKNNK